MDIVLSSVLTFKETIHNTISRHYSTEVIAYYYSRIVSVTPGNRYDNSITIEITEMKQILVFQKQKQSCGRDYSGSLPLCC